MSDINGPAPVCGICAFDPYHIFVPRVPNPAVEIRDDKWTRNVVGSPLWDESILNDNIARLDVSLPMEKGGCKAEIER